tara:strand:- start:71 stop:382 length:312 start_codon:yes stop_codon:yes gene_type:complete
VLPREDGTEKSLLEHFVESQKDGREWNADEYNSGATVTSQTPSLQEVYRAQENSGLKGPVGPSKLAPAPEEKKRRSRRRKYGGDAKNAGPSAKFDLSAFIEDD